MKRKIMFLVAVAGTLLGCNEQSVDKTEQPDPIELTDFKGETVVVPTGFPKELFDQSPEDFEIYYNSVSKTNKSNASEGISTLSYEELQPILQKCIYVSRHTI